MSWIDNSTGEEPDAETLSDMYQQLSALEEEAVEVPEEAAEEEAAYEEAAEEDSLFVVEMEPAEGQRASPDLEHGLTPDKKTLREWFTP